MSAKVYRRHQDQLIAEEDEQEYGFSDVNDCSEEVRSVEQSGEQSYGSQLQVYLDDEDEELEEESWSDEELEEQRRSDGEVLINPVQSMENTEEQAHLQ